MHYRILGKTGLEVSPLCLGTMQFGWTVDKPTSFLILSAAYEAGLNFIDTADIYSRWVQGNPGGVSETIIGEWIRERKIPRDRLVIATKVRGEMGDGPNDQGLSRAHIFAAVEASLKRLGTDYLDLYQAHWYDEHTPIEETLTAFNDLITLGKVRYIGCSNYPAWRLMEALWVSDTRNLARYATIQPHYNLVHRAEFERELSEVCRSFGLGVIPYSPLAAGFLTGKYRREGPLPDSDRAKGVRHRHFSDKNWSVLEKIETLGRDQGAWTPSQVALAWLLADPLITSPIIGPRTLEQFVDNLGALQMVLSPDEKKAVDKASAWSED